jgi:O-antigen ligase/Tfp pilus assembly protein PilF
VSERVQRLVLGMVFLWAPLAFFPPAAEGFTLTKELLAASGLAFLMASIDAGTWRRALADGVVRAALVLAAWMFGVSLFTAPSKAEVFRGIVHTLLLGGSVAAATLWVLSRPEAWRRALALSVLAGGIMALLGILQGMGLDRALHWTSRFDGRVFSTMGNPNYLGGHLAAVLPPAFLLALSARGGRRALWGGIAALLFAALLLSRVRGAFLATAASFTLLGLLFAAPWGRPLARPNRGLLLSGYAVALLAGLLTVASLGGFSIFSLRGETARQRLDTWQAAWLMVKDRPLLGWGVEQLKVLYPAYQHRPFKPEGYARHPYTYTEHVHNEFLRIHLEGGLAGLALFLALLFLHARALARRLSDPSLGDADRALLIGSAGGVAAVLVQSLSNFPLQISPTTVLFGLFLAGPAAAGGGTVSPGAWRGFGRPLAVTALVLLVGTRALAASVAFRNLAGELQLGNARQASEFGRRLLSLDPGHSKGWFNYGKALEAERLPATAIEAYQRAARENPYYVEALAAEAAVQLQNGQPIPAFVAAEKAAGIAPNYAGPHFIRGTALFGFGRFGEAANAFRAALLVVPDHFDSWLNLGTCLIKDGDRDGAVAAWRRALELKPGDPTATSYLRANQAIP